MRTLFEIIESAKDGKMPTHDECYWAMLAIDALWYFDQQAVRRMTDGKEHKFMTPAWERKESFNRNKAALKKDPKTWVGWENDPANPEYQKRRNVALKILKKVEQQWKQKKGQSL